ncbi:MAG TPA: rRNA adenine N-6-methyltransferase family protein [Terriglobales bacterium]|nr:rRNA adenine N-6-methyltransferase family protein [Terriglobales bacterium]
MAGSTAGLRTRNLHKLKSRQRGHKTPIEQAGLFLKNFLRHPLMLGSVIPSSRYLIARVLDRIDWNQTNIVVEYGPGVGTFTRPILDRMAPQAKLLTIELNEEFAELLRADISDHRLHIAHGSAVEVQKWMHFNRLTQADLILSGIPYTVLPADVRQRILTATRDALTPSGSFVVYQYTRAVLPDLQRVFSRVEEEFEPLNILPARVFRCWK